LHLIFIIFRQLGNPDHQRAPVCVLSRVSLHVCVSLRCWQTAKW